MSLTFLSQLANMQPCCAVLQVQRERVANIRVVADLELENQYLANQVAELQAKLAHFEAGHTGAHSITVCHDICLLVQSAAYFSVYFCPN